MKLSELQDHPERAFSLQREEIPGLLGELERLRATLWLRLMPGNQEGHHQAAVGLDRLLNVEEAARKLGKSKDYLYRHSGKYPFTVRDGRSLRFSEQGIEKYIKQRIGR
jgi:excisionase family DNA binding protein